MSRTKRFPFTQLPVELQELILSFSIEGPRSFTFTLRNVNLLHGDKATRRQPGDPADETLKSVLDSRCARASISPLPNNAMARIIYFAYVPERLDWHRYDRRGDDVFLLTDAYLHLFNIRLSEEPVDIGEFIDLRGYGYEWTNPRHTFDNDCHITSNAARMGLALALTSKTMLCLVLPILRAAIARLTQQRIELIRVSQVLGVHDGRERKCDDEVWRLIGMTDRERNNLKQLLAALEKTPVEWVKTPARPTEESKAKREWHRSLFTHWYARAGAVLGLR